MAITYSAALDVTATTNPEELSAWALGIPAGTPITCNVKHIPKDRPWESDQTKVELLAIWTSK